MKKCQPVHMYSLEAGNALQRTATHYATAPSVLYFWAIMLIALASCPSFHFWNIIYLVTGVRAAADSRFPLGLPAHGATEASFRLVKQMLACPFVLPESGVAVSLPISPSSKTRRAGRVMHTCTDAMMQADLNKASPF